MVVDTLAPQGKRPKAGFPDREAPAEADLEGRAEARCLFSAAEAAGADQGRGDPKGPDLQESKD